MLNSSILGGVLAGSLPTVSMLLCSLLAFNVKFSSTFEASAQNYCAGLILGAVAKELFPEIEIHSKKENLVGITVGFFIGLFFVNFQDYFVTWIENLMSSWTKEDANSSGDENDTAEREYILTEQNASYNSLESGDFSPNPGTNISEVSECESPKNGDAPIMLLAAQAIASPIHRQRIRSKMTELMQSISSIEQKSRFLHSYLHQSIPQIEAEKYADQVDEEIHKLQYSIDHCRRLIQGCESNIEGVVPRLWITHRGINSVKKRLAALKHAAQGVFEALHDDDLSTDTLVGVHKGMNHMDLRLHELHKAIEGYSFKWGRRGKKRIIAVPSTTGSFVPTSLIIPVVVDCIVDGFLVGSTSSISPRAGLILGFANMIEMGFLGLAVSLRVKQCTGSSALARYASLVFPPLIMLSAALVGALSGSAASAHPVVFIGFISFGIVALLYLVVNELLVEAREAQGSTEYWWTNMVLFLGIYSVILLDMVVA